MNRRNFLKLLGISGAAAATVGAGAGVDKLFAKGPEGISQKVDSIETIGLDSPLTQFELRVLIDSINKENIRLKENTYYGTFFISEKALKEFNANLGGESFQSFLRRHTNVLDALLKAANPPISGGFKVNRLVVLRDGTQPPSLYELSNNNWAAKGMRDSDGYWNFSSFYQPKHTSYYDAQQNIDYGLIHEWGHTILNLADHYALDVEPQPSQFLDKESVGIPVEWRRYMSRERNDLGSPLMIGGREIDRYSALQLKRREAGGFTHDQNRNYVFDRASWPIEFPESVDLKFFTDEGKPIEVAKIEIRQTQAKNKKGEIYNERINPTAHYIGPSNNLDPKTVFDCHGKHYIPHGSGTVHILIEDRFGIQYFRWMDVRDFNIPYWQGKKDKATLKLKAVRTHDERQPNPKNFDWKIRPE